MVDIAAALFKGISELVLGAVKKRVAYEAESFLTRLKIDQACEKAVRKVVEQLVPFLESERIGEERQALLVGITLEELGLLIREPERLFRASLDGQQAFDQLYVGRAMPEALVHEDLVSVFAMVGPRIASLLCELPAVVEQWKHEKFREDYRRFDDVVGRLQAIAEKVDAMAAAPAAAADEILRRLRQALTQRLEMDLTGLRSDQPTACRFEDLFVHPELFGAAGAFGAPKVIRQVKTVHDEAGAVVTFLAPHCRAVLSGPPGAGKSTWTKWLTRQALEEGRALAAVRVELRRFGKDEPPSFQALIRQAAGPHLAENLDNERIRRWVDDGKLAFVMDGFDELPPDRRDLLRGWIVGLAQEVGTCPLLLTSRPLTTNHLDTLEGQWERWEVKAFDAPRIVQYIEKWYRHMPLLADAARKVNATELAAQWKADPTIEPLTGNPLLLSTLLVVHHLDGRLPHGRAQLYRRYVEGMLGGWDERREVAASAVTLEIYQKRRILQGLALSMQLAERDQLDEDATANIVQDMLVEVRISATPEAVLSALRERTGLLIGPGTYSFSHKSIAEFLVAEAVVEGVQKDKSGNRLDRLFLYRKRHEDRWNTVLFLWAGLAPARDVEEFVGVCLDSGSRNDLALAIGLLYDQPERLPASLQRRAFELLIAREAGSPPFKGRIGVTAAWSVHGTVEGMFEVRGVGLVDGMRVLRTWSSSGVFDVSDLARMAPAIRPWFSTFLPLASFDIATWEAALRNFAQRNDAAEFGAMYHLHERLVYSADTAATLSAFEKALPSLAPRRVFVLLDALTSASGECFYNLLGALPSLVEGEIDELLLRDYPSLLEFTADLKQRIVFFKGPFAGDGVVEAALAALSALQTRQAALRPS